MTLWHAKLHEIKTSYVLYVALLLFLHPQPSLVATTNKDTLLKVSHMMGLDTQSTGPKSFRGFYTDRALARFGAAQRREDESMRSAFLW